MIGQPDTHSSPVGGPGRTPGSRAIRFGSAVTVVERAPRIVAREDVEISAAIAQFLRHEVIEAIDVIDVIEATDVIETTSVSFLGGGTIVTLGDGRKMQASHVLVASGGVPNSDGLGLETVSRTSRRGDRAEHQPADARRRTGLGTRLVASDPPTVTEYLPTIVGGLQPDAA